MCVCVCVCVHNFSNKVVVTSSMGCTNNREKQTKTNPGEQKVKFFLLSSINIAVGEEVKGRRCYGGSARSSCVGTAAGFEWL